MVRGYYNGLNFENPADARKFLNVLAVFMSGLETKIENDPHNYNSYLREGLSAFQKQLTREGYQYQNDAIAPIRAAARLADAKAIAASFDATHITDQIHRIEASIDVDPALAIGTAKELTESCFKTILGDRNIEYSSSDDLLQLGKKVFRALKLVADDIPNSAKGADTIKRLLNNLSTVVQGLAELRGLYGTGHGKDGRTRGITPRHARLAVGTSTALVTFVFQTHLETKEP